MRVSRLARSPQDCGGHFHVPGQISNGDSGILRTKETQKRREGAST